jgi:hypothetical protein
VRLFRLLRPPQQIQLWFSAWDPLKRPPEGTPETASCLLPPNNSE